MISLKILLNCHVFYMLFYGYQTWLLKRRYMNTSIFVNYDHVQETETNHYFIPLTNGKRNCS